MSHQVSTEIGYDDEIDLMGLLHILVKENNFYNSISSNIDIFRGSSL